MISSKLFKIFYSLTAFVFISFIVVLAIVVSISFDLPQINSLSDYNPPIPSRIYSQDGQLLLEMGKENRVIAQFDEIPPLILNAFLAAEDDNFYNHAGVDYIGIARAMIKNIKAGRIVQGASTITQQVAKSLLLTSERTYTRKIKDLLLAKKIEEKFTKEEILYLYLNQVYLGGGYYGVKSAVKGYFDKDLNQVTVAEAALVAGLLVAPGKYSPYNNPKYAKMRQQYVLKRLFVTNKINQEEYEAALEEPISLRIRKVDEIKAGYFTDWVKQRVIDELGVDEFLTQGYEIYTTIDWDLQKKAEEFVLEGVKETDKRQGFKGPIGFIDSSNLEQHIIEERKEFYKEKSQFFTLFKDSTTKSEFQFNEKEIEDNKEFETRAIEESGLSKRQLISAPVGQNLDDPLMNFIKTGESYNAVVEYVNDSQRMIYVDFMGLKGMIPYEYFRWAHERDIKAEKHWYAYVKRPSTIVKPGDVINVAVMKLPTSTWRYLWRDYKSAVKNNSKLTSFIKNQKRYLLLLDQEPTAQAALLSASPKTGNIISLVGGYDFNKSQFNRVVQSNRQPGSAFKPFIYAVGLENGFNAASIILDSPQALDSGLDNSLLWKPRNYDGKFKGEMTFRRALETSRNIPTIRLTQEVGVEKIISFADRLKLNTQLPSDLSVSLGSFGINLLDLVRAYSVFPSGGKMIELKSITNVKDRFGREYHFKSDKTPEQKSFKMSDDVLDNEETTAKQQVFEAGEIEEKEKQNPFLVNLSENQVYDERLAYIMSNILKGVIEVGTGRGANDIGTYIGGKTGTTNNYVDAWFLGFSSDLVTGVWTGFDDNKTLGWGETGAKSALPIWKKFMSFGLRKYPEKEFDLPGGIINVAINRETGKLAQDNDGNIFMESFVEGTQPTREATEIIEDIDSEQIDQVINSEDLFLGQ